MIGQIEEIMKNNILHCRLNSTMISGFGGDSLAFIVSSNDDSGSKDGERPFAGRGLLFFLASSDGRSIGLSNENFFVDIVAVI